MQYTTAGEWGGQALIAIVDDVPAGLRLETDQVESDLERCQRGYGFPETEAPFKFVEISSGVANGRTTGAPVAFLVFGEGPQDAPDLHGQSSNIVRIGRGDLSGFLKSAADDAAAVARRLDAFDEAACVVAASVAREYLAELDVDVRSYVSAIGSVSLPERDLMTEAREYTAMATEFSPVRCPNERTSGQMITAIEKARAIGTTLGGVFRVVIDGLVPGLGGYAQRRDRLTAKLSAALFSLPYVVGVEFGGGFSAASKTAGACYDAAEIMRGQGFSRASNNEGGLEDGLTSGQPLVITVAVEPPAWSPDLVRSLNLDTLTATPSPTTWKQTCCVPGAAVAAEAEVAFVIANAYAQQFGAANMTDTRAAVEHYAQRLGRAAR